VPVSTTVGARCIELNWDKDDKFAPQSARANGKERFVFPFPFYGAAAGYAGVGNFVVATGGACLCALLDPNRTRSVTMTAARPPGLSSRRNNSGKSSSVDQRRNEFECAHGSFELGDGAQGRFWTRFEALWSGTIPESRFLLPLLVRDSDLSHESVPP
jgi:hypothetical protein